MDSLVKVAQFHIGEGRDIQSVFEFTAPVFNGKTTPVKVVPQLDKLVSALNISPWGENNLLPNEIKADINSNPLLKRALKFRIDAHYGRGVKLFKEVHNEGKLSYELSDDKTILDWLRRNWIDKTQMGFISDWEFFRNMFPIVILDKGRKNINRIYRQHAMHCRWERMKDDGKINFLHVADWSSSKVDEKSVSKISVLDAYDPIGDLKSRKSGYKFVLPIKAEEFDNLYYDETYWEPIRKTWLPIACSIPELKAAIMKNQMMLKYHIKIPLKWIEKKIKELSLDTPTKVQEFLDELTTKLDDYLTDTNNYGKSFISYYGVDPIHPQNALEEWKIDVLDNKLKNEDHLPDAQAANSEIVTAVGVDPTLFGGTLPGGNEAGSGSNKREAYSIHQAQLGSDRMYTNRWFQLIAEYNGWSADLCLRNVDIDTSQTLDENPTGSKTTT